MVNCGQEDQEPNQPGIPQDWPSNGVFLDRFTTRDYQVTASRITDGTQHTLLLSENLQAGPWNESIDPLLDLPRTMEDQVGMVWWIDRGNPENRPVPPLDGYQINDMDAERPRPSSNHPGGVNVVFCDGHCQFLREDIDYLVYARLMTPDGNNAMVAGTRTPIGKTTEPTDFWQNVPLNAKDYID